MSVISLEFNVFRAVDNKLQSFGACTYVNKEHNSRFPRQVFDLHGFSGNDIRQIKQYNNAVTEWVTSAACYNKSSYYGRYGTRPGWALYEAGEAEDITLVQCYKFLQCIMYNTDIDSYMDPTIYEERYKAEYEAWREQGRKMLHFIASHIVEHSDEYEAARWSSL